MEEAQHIVQALERKISEAQEKVRKHTDELATLGNRLVEARAVLKAEVAKAEEVKLAELRTELAQHLHELDQRGWNSTGEKRVTEILAAFRMARRSGHSAETLRVYIEKMRSPTGGRDPKRSWSNLLNWITPEKEAA
jgi:predicted nuclease with TOPRIM domain